MLRRLLQPIWVLLAIIFLIEAWLWDHLEPIVAWFVALIPLRAFKQWLADRVVQSRRPPQAPCGRAQQNPKAVREL